MSALLLLLSACAGSGDDIDKGDTAEADADTDADSDTDTDADTDTDTPETVTLAGECEDAVHWGNFTIDSNEDYASVSGQVSNGVVPTTVLTNTLTTGDCTIWRRENPFCDPTCEPGYTCALDGTCVLYPEGQDLGTAAVSGLLEDVTMEPVTPGYRYFDTSLPNPPWTPGSVVTVTTTGGVYEPVTLHGVTPTAFTPGSLAWTVVEGEPFAMTWDAPAGPVRTEVVLTLSIDQHGVTPSHVACVFADDGAGEVPADVLEALMEFGVSGFPAGSIARRTADSTVIGDGCVDLLVTESRLPSVSIEGYTPCRADTDCPDGQECNEAMERCE